MLADLASLILPAFVLVVTLFGLLARGNPKPGGVALFARVGIVCLALGAGAFYLVEKTAVISGGAADVARQAYRGIVGAAVLLLTMAAFGAALKKK